MLLNYLMEDILKGIRSWIASGVVKSRQYACYVVTKQKLETSNRVKWCCVPMAIVKVCIVQNVSRTLITNALCAAILSIMEI